MDVALLSPYEIRNQITKLIECENQRAILSCRLEAHDCGKTSDYVRALKSFGAELKKLNEDETLQIDGACFPLLRRFVESVCGTYRHYLAEMCTEDSSQTPPQQGPKTIFAPNTLPPNANAIKDQVPLIRLTAAPQTRGWGVLDSSGLDKV